LAAGMIVLVVADLVLASSNYWLVVFVGSILWGVHMGLTQGLLAALVSHSAPSDLRGTAFGMFNLASGISMLVASVLAGVLWEYIGAPATFLSGALLSVLALALFRTLHLELKTKT
ncbi:MAG: MFS transporter, partial [Pseudomonadales bacterium]|nr:MFS transporter [Pseudomonadales bacterium]